MVRIRYTRRGDSLVSKTLLLSDGMLVYGLIEYESFKFKASLWSKSAGSSDFGLLSETPGLFTRSLAVAKSWVKAELVAHGANFESEVRRRRG